MNIVNWTTGETSKNDDRSLNECKEYRLTILRSIVSQEIKDSGLDTATQQNASLGIYSPERCEAIKSYIAACRNEYLRCKALILAATTNDEADAIQFNAPSIPEGL